MKDLGWNLRPAGRVPEDPGAVVRGFNDARRCTGRLLGWAVVDVDCGVNLDAVSDTDFEVVTSADCCPGAPTSASAISVSPATTSGSVSCGVPSPSTLRVPRAGCRRGWTFGFAGGMAVVYCSTCRFSNAELVILDAGPPLVEPMANHGAKRVCALKCQAKPHFTHPTRFETTLNQRRVIMHKTATLAT